MRPSPFANTLLLALVLVAGPAAAWSNHALCTWPALSVLPRVAAAPPVQVESLESFLAAEAGPLVGLLAEEERWARAHVVAYPPRPEALAFALPAGAAPAELRRRFVAALRINPEARLALFLQLMPTAGTDGRPFLAESAITTLKRNETTRSNSFVGLHEGAVARVIDVVATASDEPDHGLDVGLWSDSGSAAGAAYGFGRQPFGFNPQIEFASQGPFHVGFFHESWIVYKAAPFLLKTYAEYRIHLYRALAVHALRSGHPYWGWRFAGWALHYIQDLTQPYHASVLPGVGVPTMLWINTLDLAGRHAGKERAVALVTNRHLALENLQLHRARTAWLRRDAQDPTWRALTDTAHDAGAAYTDATPRERITKDANAAADAVDAALARHLPAKYTSDPGYVFGETETGVDLARVVDRSAPEAGVAMGDALARLLGRFGAETRAFVRALPTGAR
jgi:hypothetical protein